MIAAFDTPATIWLVAGVVLVICEVVLPGMFLLWLGLAALGTGLVLLGLPLGFGMQVLLFGVLAMISVAIAVNRIRQIKRPNINLPGSGLIGRPAIALGFAGREGRVRVGDSDWPARLVGSASVSTGAALVVDGVDGVVLLVCTPSDAAAGDVAED